MRRPSTWLVFSSWVSAALFGGYVLINYLGAVFADLERWNFPLPRLYDPGHPGATASIGAHFATGALLLFLGPLQLLRGVRERWAAVHRWLGRLTVVAAALTGVAGCGFIVMQGTIGGAPMNVGFGLYGVLMTVAAVQTARFARARQLERHRAWALRLYALIIGSWLYRMEYGFLFALARGAGHSRNYDAAVDVVMAFFFYVPNLALVEAWLRAGPTTSRWRAVAFEAVALLATLLVLVGTWFFVANLWGPAVLEVLSPSPVD